jgi:hypothetical protein
MRGHVEAAQCAAWSKRIELAHADWTSAFSGEQFSLGRAFYTHFEEDKSRDYFDDVAKSDRLVEAHAPGLQAAMGALVTRITGEGCAVQRRGWCGPGVHIFPCEGPVAERGGVRHFDTEGLAAHHRDERRPAISIVVPLQVAEASGGLRVWDVRYEGRDHPTAAELARPSETVRYGVGDVVLFDSYRLHQIEAFSGARARITATVHAARVGSGLWEYWF